MERPGYQRFGLIANPFHDLASESLEEIELFHVPQEEDASFEALKQEVLERQRKALVMIIGPVGAGKTQRLRLTEAQAPKVDAWASLHSLANSPRAPAKGLAAAILADASRRKLRGGWAGVLGQLAKEKPVAPEAAGEAIAAGLNALAPAFLLLNDVDALEGPPLAQFLAALTAAASHLKPGVMLALTCGANDYQLLTARHPALSTRVNRVIAITTMATQEAQLMVAKRLAGSRIVEDLDPLYPFTASAVAALNQAAGGSPRRLLQLADLVLEAGVRQRRFSIDEEMVAAAIAVTRNDSGPSHPEGNGHAARIEETASQEHPSASEPDAETTVQAEAPPGPVASAKPRRELPLQVLRQLKQRR